MLGRSPRTETEKDADRANALSFMAVAPETRDRLEAYVEILRKWNRSTQLISPKSLPSLWTRHIADSAQLIELAPRARIWMDIGSGAGLPGLVIAICLAENPGVRVHCIESDTRKAAFLSEVVRTIGLPVDVHNIRITAPSDLPLSRCDVVTARAFASVDKLIPLARPYLQSGAIGIFPRGRQLFGSSLVSAVQQGFRVNYIASAVDPRASILTIQSQVQEPMDLA